VSTTEHFYSSIEQGLDDLNYRRNTLNTLFRPRITSLCHDVCDTLMSRFISLAVIRGQTGISRWAPLRWPTGRQLRCGLPTGRWEVPRGTQVDGEREERESFIRNRGDRRVAGACPEVGEGKSVTVYCCLCVGQCTENTTTVH